MYALMWAEVTLVTWQFLAIWKQILVPVFLGSGTCLRPLLLCAHQLALLALDTNICQACLQATASPDHFV